MSYNGNRFSHKDQEILKKAAEARKQGKKLPEYDEKGQLINPYIPMYISKAPWYVSSGSGEDKVSSGLQHQKIAEKHTDSSAHHVRGLILGEEAHSRKFRKGACENCGAMTHKTKECLERPRQKGAKWTGKDIRPDEYIEEAKLDFEGKRDRWAGYDTSEYDEQYKKWNEIEEANEESPSSSESEVEFDIPGEKVELKTRNIIRNLRLREDTAKYLVNLSEDATKYDPKTRSMRNVKESDDQFIAAQETTEESKEQVFVWDSKRVAKNIVNLDETMGSNSTNNKFSKKVKLDESLISKYLPILNDQSASEIVEESDKYLEFDKSGNLTKITKSIN